MQPVSAGPGACPPGHVGSALGRAAGCIGWDGLMISCDPSPCVRGGDGAGPSAGVALAAPGGAPRLVGNGACGEGVGDGAAAGAGVGGSAGGGTGVGEGVDSGVDSGAAVGADAGAGPAEGAGAGAGGAGVPVAGAAAGSAQGSGVLLNGTTHCGPPPAVKGRAKRTTSLRISAPGST